MKKIVAILALCAFVSVSSAAIVFQAPASVNPGETFTVNVISTDASVRSLSLSVAITDSTNDVAWSNNVMAISGTFSTNGTLIAPGNVVGLAIRGASGTAATGAFVAANQVLFSFQVTAGTSDITINDYNGSAASAGLSGAPMQSKWTVYTGGSDASANIDMDSIVVAVPEPMTMALLGLGGLFIRRRRA